jgi:hypothetical protein
MTLPLALGQVSDPVARQAFEQIALRWPSPPTVPVVTALPAVAAPGTVLFLTTDNHLYVYSSGWKQV